MATFYTRPEITLAGLQNQPDLLSIYGRLLQLQQMRDERRHALMREEEANLRLSELRRMAQEGQAVRGAMAAGVERPPQISNEIPSQGPLGVPGTKIPFLSNPPAPRTTFNPSAVIERLQGIAPHLVPEVQQQFAAADFTRAEQRAKLDKELALKSKAELDVIGEGWDLIGRGAQAVVEASPEIQSQVYSSGRQQLMASGNPIIQNIVQKSPEQFSPELMPQLHSMIGLSTAVKDSKAAIERRRHNLAMEKKRSAAETPFAVWREQHPDADVSEYFRLQPEARADVNQKPKDISRQRNLAETQKNAALRRAEDTIRKRFGLTGFAATEAWPQEAADELNDLKQQIQDEYETKLSNLGVDVKPFDYSQQGQRRGANVQGAGQTLDRNNPEHRRIAAEILAEAGGDKEKAREIARRRNFKF